ncbi:unnamed protein product [Spodoptera littoralis]|uniref:Uncharacterized protein n=1 Tax=Spodoptera littoralis TaxID=7109 RepID=A0A9P0N1B6_SPOLI|nr:unnamed protein product [Spodoptera littoralis]CAH1638840.1 unnamed protein product [Spodoptera littoralis]
MGNGLSGAASVPALRGQCRRIHAAAPNHREGLTGVDDDAFVDVDRPPHPPSSNRRHRRRCVRRVDVIDVNRRVGDSGRPRHCHHRGMRVSSPSPCWRRRSSETSPSPPMRVSSPPRRWRRRSPETSPSPPIYMRMSALRCRCRTRATTLTSQPRRLSPKSSSPAPPPSPETPPAPPHSPEAPPAPPPSPGLPGPRCKCECGLCEAGHTLNYFI